MSRGGAYQANGATRQADVLLALGVRFDDRTSISWIPGYSFTIPPTKLIHVDIDPEEIGRNYPVALGLMADVRTFLRQVLAELDTPQGRRRRGGVARRSGSPTIDGMRKEWDRVHRAGLHRRLDADPSAARRRPKSTRRCPTTPSWSATSACTTTGCCSSASRSGRTRFIGCMGFGAMGFGVAGVLGAKFAAPDRPCVSVCGDGAFFMHANVLGTAVEYNLPVVWVVWNNYAYALDPRVAARLSRTAASSPPTSSIRRPASRTIRTSPRWRARPASRASASTAPATSATRCKMAIAANKPYLIDVNINADQNPGGAGVWELPGLGVSKVGDRRAVSAVALFNNAESAYSVVMARLVPAIHSCLMRADEDVDAQHKAGHDDR